MEVDLSDQEAEAGRRPRRGRPRLDKTRTSETGLGAVLSARISVEVRRALEAEANRTGRSISQIADSWLSQAASARATVEEQLGGTAIAPTIRAMISFARRVQDEIGNPLSDPKAYGALIAGFTFISETFPALAKAELATLRADLRATCARLCDQLEAWPFEVEPEAFRAFADGEFGEGGSQLSKLQDGLEILMRFGDEQSMALAGPALDACIAYRGAVEASVAESMKSMIRGHEMAAEMFGTTSRLSTKTLVDALRRQVEMLP